MTPLLRHYLYKQFFIWAIFLLAGLSMLLLLFDAMAHADDILAHHDNILKPLGAYALLRLPQIINLILPLTVLLTVIILISRLVETQQIIAIRSFGSSLLDFVKSLLPAVAAITIVHILFASVILPGTTRTLNHWEANDYMGSPQEIFYNADSNWFEDGPYFVHVEQVQTEQKKLVSLTVIEKNQQNQIEKYYTADNAVYEGGAWSYRNLLKRHDFGKQAQDTTPVLTMAPDKLSRLKLSAGEVSLGRLLIIWREQTLETDNNSTPYPYSFWFNRKLAHPLGSLLMLLLATPLALQISRRQKIMRTSFGIILAGFAFFIVERLLFSLGETGTLPPLIAAWTPLCIFSALGLWLLIVYEES